MHSEKWQSSRMVAKSGEGVTIGSERWEKYQSYVAIFGVVSATPNLSIGEIDDELKIETFSKWKRWFFCFSYVSFWFAAGAYVPTQIASRISFHVCAVKRVRKHCKYYFLHILNRIGQERIKTQSNRFLSGPTDVCNFIIRIIVDHIYFIMSSYTLHRERCGEMKMKSMRIVSAIDARTHTQSQCSKSWSCSENRLNEFFDISTHRVWGRRQMQNNKMNAGNQPAERCCHRFDRHSLSRSIHQYNRSFSLCG